ncbi:MAG TPA: LEA type 2 family protein [Polyangiales bacterium]|nr:LEA type 2 family protein [Polyangiales bacterium]
MSVRRVDITSVNFAGVSANIVFAVQNPNVIGVDLASFGYQLSVDGHALVQGAIAKRALHVPAGGTGEMQVPIGFQFVQLTEALESLFTKREVPFTIATQLGFGSPIGVIEVPLAYSNKFPVPQLPTFALAGATVGSAGVQGADLSTTIQVHNPNGFALPVGALGVAVSVSGVKLADASTPPQQLGANATVPIRLGAHLDYLRAGLGIVNAIQSHSATVTLDGNFDLLGYGLPIHLRTTLR